MYSDLQYVFKGGLGIFQMLMIDLRTKGVLI
jgi:hypothetical protein